MNQAMPQQTFSRESIVEKKKKETTQLIILIVAVAFISLALLVHDFALKRNARKRYDYRLHHPVGGGVKRGIEKKSENRESDGIN